MKDFFRPSDSHRQAPPTPVLSARFGDALCMAVGLHRNHARKGTSIPYASHLLAVAALVLEHGGTEDQAIAALLHDAVEDQSGGDPAGLKREIEQRFGRAVLDVVLACSDSEVSIDKPNWEERKQRYIDHIRSAPAEVRLVSLADKTHNARAILRDHKAIGDEVWKRFNRPKDKILWYYEELMEAFRGRGNPVLYEEFETMVAEIRARC